MSAEHRHNKKSQPHRCRPGRVAMAGAFVCEPQSHSAHRNLGSQMKPPTGTAPVIDDRRVAPRGTALTFEDRRVAVTDRRISPRMRTLKGGQIVWPTGTSVKCIIRNLSETGACLEVHSPVPHTFELVFDGDESRRSCRVVWRKETRIGVEFIAPPQVPASPARPAF